MSMQRRTFLTGALGAMGLAWGGPSRGQDFKTAAAAAWCGVPAALRDKAARFEAEINLVRTQPESYADIIAREMASLDAWGTYMRAGYRIRTQEGHAAVVEAVTALRQQRPVAPMALSSCLSVAAQSHAHFLGRVGAVGHFGPGGSTPSQRAAQALGDRVPVGETVSAGPGSAREHVIALLIDDGVPDRGHRVALLHPGYRTLGIGYAPHPFGSVSVQMLCEQHLPV
jgi:uncharacterized protein YkwD